MLVASTISDRNIYLIWELHQTRLIFSHVPSFASKCSIEKIKLFSKWMIFVIKVDFWTYILVA